MSKIKQLIQARLNELAILELDEEEQALRTPEMSSISIRMTKDSIKQLDLIAEHLKLSRSDVARSFLVAGASEAMQALNLSTSDVVDFLERYEEAEGRGAVE